MSSRAEMRNIISELKHRVSQNIRKVVSRFIEISSQKRSQWTFSSCFLPVHTFYRCDSWAPQAIGDWLKIAQQTNGAKMLVSNFPSRGLFLHFRALIACTYGGKRRVSSPWTMSSSPRGSMWTGWDTEGGWREWSILGVCLGKEIGNVA